MKSSKYQSINNVKFCIMKKHLLLLGFIVFALLFSSQLSAQVAVNATGALPDASAMLDVSSTTSGVLITRMTEAERIAIPAPATGLMVFQTNSWSGFYYYNGSIWKRISEDRHYIGEFFGGGIVFWVDSKGEHGLIASLVDLGGPPALTIWQGAPFATGATSSWDGLTNTNTAYASCVAVSWCYFYININYGTGVYGDWYMPSMKELSMMYQQQWIINKSIQTAPPMGWNILSNSLYWSSTEYDANNTWALNCGTGVSGYFLKAVATAWVRGVRSF